MSCTKQCCEERKKAYKKFVSTFDKAEIGKETPQFKAAAYHPDGTIKEVDISEYKGKYVVLLFYPLDWTFVCPTEMIGYSELAGQLKELNCEVLGVSVDSVYCHQAWCETDRKNGGVGKLNFPLISDIKKCISISYGMLNVQAGISRRGYVIIDDKGIVRYIQINDDGIGRSTDETIRIVKAIQFTDQHGAVCPLNWKPGNDTIEPSHDGIKKYLSSH
uniref:Peroxiredoxin n=1 Tax=Entamoeba moshkovskii TaxID=41668 RepID=Q5W9B6_9EUKA|nr:peroxiredoxin [Entamoeba moshkovskii]